jgi:hypothetical protein
MLHHVKTNTLTKVAYFSKLYHHTKFCMLYVASVNVTDRRKVKDMTKRISSGGMMFIPGLMKISWLKSYLCGVDVGTNLESYLYLSNKESSLNMHKVYSTFCLRNVLLYTNKNLFGFTDSGNFHFDQ